MANTEDYLDGLLDSITQAKNEDDWPNDRGSRNRSRREERRGRSRVRPDDDFMEATGLNSYRREQKRNRRERRHAEENFLRSFEDELSMGDADEVIRSFERELRSDADDESRLDMMKRVYRGRIIPLIVIFLCAVTPQFILNLIGYDGGSQLQTVFAVVFGGIFVLYVVIFVRFGIAYKRYKDRIGRLE